MRLADLTAEAEIFIDANVFTYFALQNQTFQADCTAFLSRVEAGEVRGVTSVFALNEAFYTMLVGKGSELLSSTKIKQIKAKLATDPAFSAACYQACIEFSQYVAVLRAAGLRLVEVDYDLQVKALPLGQHDALHLATCQQYGIPHLATADSHFDQVVGLTVWKPASN